jgi:hypothetical protein
VAVVSISHRQWTEWGDAAESVKDWAITTLFVIMAAVSFSVLGVAAFLFLLQLIGDLT